MAEKEVSINLAGLPAVTNLLTRAKAEIDRLTAEVERLQTLVRTVAMYGQAFIYEPPEGERVTLNPIYVTVVLAADHLTEAERLTAANADLTDRLDRTLAELREVAKERDRLKAEVRTCTEVARIAQGHYNAANAALADVTDLLDEARTERDKVRAEVAEEIARAIDAADHANGGTGPVAIAYRAAQQADARIAREHATAPTEVQP